MQIQKPNVSFGMAYKVDAKSFRNFSPENMNKVKGIIESSKTQLDETTKGVLFHIIGSNNSEILVGTSPKKFGFFNELKYCWTTIKDTIREKDIPAYMKKIGLSNFSEDTLIDSAKSTKEAYLKKETSAKEAKRILGDLSSK